MVSEFDRLVFVENPASSPRPLEKEVRHREKSFVFVSFEADQSTRSSSRRRRRHQHHLTANIGATQAALLVWGTPTELMPAPSGGWHWNCAVFVGPTWRGRFLKENPARRSDFLLKADPPPGSDLSFTAVVGCAQQIRPERTLSTMPLVEARQLASTLPAEAQCST